MSPPTTTVGLPPLSDGLHWRPIVRAGALRRYSAGALLALYDARDAGTDPRLANAIIGHVLFAARLILHAKMNRGTPNRYEAIDDAVGEVAVAAADPTIVALREYFGSYVMRRGQDASRAEYRSSAGSAQIVPDEMVDRQDPENAIVARADLLAILATIQDPDHRSAFLMKLSGWSVKDIALALGKHRTTIAEWLRAIMKNSPKEPKTP